MIDRELHIPRVLVISHTSFTYADSMGSTLASYFKTYNPDCIAQFYIKEMQPDIPVCKNYYCVTDHDLLDKLRHPFKKTIGKIIRLSIDNNITKGRAAEALSMGAHRHRDIAMLARKMLWRTKMWNNKSFKDWIHAFSPQVILVQPGDFSYLLDIGSNLAKKLNIPIIVHQSESYYLKEYEKNTLVYRLFRYDFKLSYSRLMRHTSCCVYLCEALEKGYSRFFHIPSETIMKATNLVPRKATRLFDKDNIHFVYGGNLGETVGRCEPLVDLGKVVKKLGFYIDVYTSSTGEHMKDLIPENGIHLHESLPYDELQNRIKDSDFVIHIESQKQWNVKDLEYAFSTKIADMLASGVCSIVYGSENIASIKYFVDHHLGCVIEDKMDIEQKLTELIVNEELRNKYIERAIEQAKKEHNPIVNSERMMEIINSTYERGYCANW